MSESTVGRILKYLMDRRLIEKSISAQRKKKRRKFDKYAQKFTFKKYEDMVLGERVQVDHMTVTKNGRTYKHFQAWERKSKVLIAQIYSRARSKDAAKFLKELVKKAPYKILSIQVDGGSEFMKEFEEACEDLGIAKTREIIEQWTNSGKGLGIGLKNYWGMSVYNAIKKIK